MEDWYEIGATVTGVLIFLAVWIGCSVAYGFLGFALGWMPALILAAIIGLFWPLLLVLLVIAALLLYAMLK